MVATSRFGFAVLALLILPCASSGQARGEKTQEIRITGYDIFEQDFEKPLTRIDERGARRTYGRAYVVHVKGSFGEPRAIPVDLFIGDYRVPEYGGTKEGIYFRIYDDTLLEKLEGRLFAYGFEGQKVRTTDVRFSPTSRKPFKRITRFP